MKKTIKKLMAALLAVALLCAMAVPAFAAEGAATGTGNTGSITITNAAKDETYTIYRIFDLESYSGNNYSYKLSSKWAGLADNATFQAYFDITTGGYVVPKSTYTGEAVKTFAAAALAFAKDATPSIANDGSETATGTSVSFSGLQLGYYLVDTTQGTLCSLDTTADHVDIIDKTVGPSIDKKIVDANGNNGVENNTASIGDVIHYQVTISAKKGATGYVLTDTMTEGLTFNNDVKVTVNGTELTSPADYSVTTPADNGATFKVTFTESYLNGLTADTSIVVTYSATLNEKAAISGDQNTNTAQLKYGNSSTVEDKTTTTSFKFDLVKTDSAGKLLAGAKFKLYDAASDGNEIKLVKIDEKTYRVAKSGETGVEIETVDTGYITINGLGNGDYWLEETQQPTGYNKLSAREKLTVKDGNLSTTMTGTTWTEGNGGVHIINNSGTVLPSTGGMGTTLFYVLGGGLMVAAVVLLVTKKRMENK
mgnify:CR=1 FL=1